MPRAKYETTKVIFKNSRNTINTYSRTYSGASQIYTKSLIFQLKNNQPNAYYYEQKGTIKRDLSIETDICILRSYYKKRRHKLINRQAVSNKSRYSGNRTEIDTIDEFKYDNSACGDSKGNINLKNTNFNVNLTSLVVQNLKKLLNHWVKKFLLDNHETKQKIETVLDSLLHNMDLQIKDTISACTYTVDIEIIDKQEGKPVLFHKIKSHTASVTQESQSVPVSGKYFRILSTLSVPKNIHRHKSKCSWTRLNKIRHQKILLSSNRSSQYLFTSSSLNFLTIPTNYFTKQCATYQQDATNQKDEQKSIALPEQLYGGEVSNSFATLTKINTLNNANNATNSALNAISSIYKNIYNYLESDKIHTLSEQSTNNVQKQSSDDAILSMGRKNEELKTPDIIKDKDNYKAEKLRKKKNKLRLRKQNIIKSKQFTYSVRKLKSHIQKEKELLYHFQSIFELISSHKCSEDVKLDIHINVFPSRPSKTGKEGANMHEYSYSPINGHFTTKAEQKCVNEDSVTHQQNIIPLLDGAASHAKYMLSGEKDVNSSENNINSHNPVVDNIAKESQIAQEISELKVIIKSLVNTTEKLVKDHLKKSFDKNSKETVANEKKNKSIELRPSVGLQFSSKHVKENSIGSGIKLKKDPKKKNKEYNPRLMKKSTSYNIIDSESILKVTDMTSAAQGQVSGRSKEDKALTCSLPKTKSLYEVSFETSNEKLLAFQYDDLSKPRQCVYNVREHKNHNIPNKNHLEPLVSETQSKSEQKPECTEFLPVGDGCGIEKSSSTVCIDVETRTTENNKKIVIRPRTALPFWEGCLYCILLWIPLVFILCLFYEYVLKNYLPYGFTLSGLIWPDKHNESHFRLMLAELGF